ncbi:MAG: efflux RND transporter permease subunit, partial [Candidatus Cloacimonetes bacterium]|nr:efflux RND transporter permease subunit [Candidatus Cloacimonadota bacterium]
MKIIKLSLDRPVTVLMVFLLILITGMVSFSRLPLEFIPDIGYPRLTVITFLDNASPEEIESLITEPVEEAVSTLKGVKEVSSRSRKDVSIVTLKYNWGTEMAHASLNLREKLDNIRYLLPDESERPNIARLDPTEEPILYLALTAKQNNNIISIQELAENLIKRRLQQIEGVAAADLIGTLEKEVEIKLFPDKLDLYGISLETIESAVSRSNFNIPGGRIKDGHYRFNLNLVGEYRSLDEIRTTPVKNNSDGSIIFLEDIAEVNISYQEVRNLNRMNSKRSIGILVRKEADANTVAVCKQVRNALKILGKEYPDIEFDIPVDQSGFIRQAINSLLEAILIGASLAYLVLFLFLKDLKSPVHISLVIPIAILASFSLMFFSRITLNIISLSGLALGVGMLVDNSIVVSESIFRHRERGRSWYQAALQGTKEVGLAITASTFTTIAVFLPIIYVTGIAASLFKQQALTVTFSLLSSLFVSITLFPLLSALRTKSKKKRSKKSKNVHDLLSRVLMILLLPCRLISRLLIKIADFFLKYPKKIMYRLHYGFNQIYDKFILIYQKILHFSLNNKRLVLLVFLAVFLISLLIILNLDRQFFPEFQQDNFTILLQRDQGTPLARTDETVQLLEEYLARDKRISSYFTSVGKSTKDMLSYYLENTSTEELAEIKINVADVNSVNRVMDDYRLILDKLPVEYSLRKSSNLLASLLELEEPGLAVILSGEDLHYLRRTAFELKTLISKEELFYEIRTDFEDLTPQIKLELNREALVFFQISADRVSSFIKAFISGEKIADFREFDRKIDITLRSDQDLALDELLEQRIIRNGENIPLRLLINIVEDRSLPEIKRVNQTRVYKISLLFRGSLKKAMTKLNELTGRFSSTDNNLRISVQG